MQKLYGDRRDADFVNLDAVAEGVVDEEAAPGNGTASFGGDAGGLQFGAQAIHVRAFKAEMAIGVRTGSLFFDGDVNIQSAGLEPNAAAMANGFRFGDFAQAEQAGVEGAGDFFGAFRHGDVDVGEAHGVERQERE